MALQPNAAMIRRIFEVSLAQRRKEFGNAWAVGLLREKTILGLDTWDESDEKCFGRAFEASRVAGQAARARSGCAIAELFRCRRLGRPSLRVAFPNIAAGEGVSRRPGVCQDATCCLNGGGIQPGDAELNDPLLEADLVFLVRI